MIDVMGVQVGDGHAHVAEYLEYVRFGQMRVHALVHELHEAAELVVLGEQEDLVDVRGLTLDERVDVLDDVAVVFAQLAAYLDLELARLQVDVVVDVHALEGVLLAVERRAHEEHDGEAALGDHLLDAHAVLAQLELLVDELRVVAARGARERRVAAESAIRCRRHRLVAGIDARLMMLVLLLLLL